MLIKYLKIISLLLVLVLGGIITIVAIFPDHTIRPLVERLCEAQVPGEVSIGSVSLGWNGVVINQITYKAHPDSSPITLARLKLKLGFADGMFKITKLVLSDLDLWASWSEKTGFNISGINLSEGSSEPIELPDFLPPIEFKEVKVYVKTPDDLYKLLLNGEVKIAKDGLEFDFDNEFNSTMFASAFKLKASGPLSKLAFNSEVNSISFMKLPKFNGTVEGVYENQTIKANLSLGSKLSQLRGTFNQDFKKDQLGLSINFSLNNLEEAMSLAGSFPYKLFGKVDGNLGIVKTSKSTSEKMALNLRDIKVESPKFILDGVSGNIDIASLESFKTQASQKLSIKSAKGFVPANNVVVTFEHKGRGVFYVNEFSADVDVGKVTGGNFIWDINKPSNSVVLDVKGISAQYIARFLKQKDAEVTGHVDGKLPMSFNDNDFGISGGKLAIRENFGTLKYRPDNSKSLDHKKVELTGQESPIDLALIALWNLHYNHLSVDLEKALGQELEITLNIKGKNPEAFSGQPFEFNLNVTGETLKAIQETLGSVNKRN